MSATTSPTLDAAFEPGMRLGKYEILDRTAQGGMALVYRARDTLLDRIVAIKQIAPHLSEDPRWRDRFRHEAQVIARLAAESRHIVQIHELLEEPRGLFIVMEFVEGHTLETLICDNKVDMQAALDILGGVCLGLRAVHTAGIVHRDIKPANLIVPPDRRAKISDFGVAAHAGGDTSMALGTTKYMAPELFSGGAVDGRADIYSLGFVAFEMFAGRKAMDELFSHLLTDDRAAAMRWMNWHLRMDQHLPRLDTINPLIPPPLAEIVAQMAAKSLNVRYPTINAVISDLKRHFTAGGAAQPAAADARGKAPGGPSDTGAFKVGTTTVIAPSAVFESETPTAALPNMMKKRRWPLIAACVGGLICIVLVSYSLLAGPNQIAEMQALFAEGRSAYQAHQYDAALKKWREAESKAVSGARGEEGRKAIAQWLPLAEAQVALARKDFGAATSKLNEAERRGAGRQSVAALRETVVRTQAATEATDRFNEALKQNDIEQASLALREIDEKSLLDAGPLGELKTQLETARGNSTYTRQMRDARQALEREDFEKALTLAQQADGQHATDASKALIKLVIATRDFKQETKAGDEALAVGDYRSAAEHYGAANQAKPSKAAENRVNHAKALEQVVIGTAAKRDNKITDALEAFDQALKFEELPEARREKTQLTAMLTVQKQIDAGQQAADAGDWATALQTWKSALEAGPTDRLEDLKTRISNAQVQLAVARGERLAKEKKWAEAKAAFEEAVKLGGGDEVKARLMAVETDRAIEEKLAAGDAAFKKGQYNDALKRYREALKLRGGPDAEVQKHIDEVNFRLFREAGLRKLAEHQFRAALADLRQAQRLHPDDKEVAARIAEAEKMGG